MIYLFNNPDKLARAIEKFKAKNPAGAVYRFDTDNWLTAQEKFEELLESGGGLFGEKNLIILSDVEELSDLEKARMEASATIVLWFRREIKLVPDFNFFALSDALGRRETNKLWLLTQKALAAGRSAEDIFWRSLVWKVRSLLLSPNHYYTRPELTSLSSSLVALWHDTKREEGRDFGLELEHLLLSL